jgi:hypothetical protein
MPHQDLDGAQIGARLEQMGGKAVGKPMSRAEALVSSTMDDFFAVADFVAFNDPAVKS